MIKEVILKSFIKLLIIRKQLFMSLESENSILQEFWAFGLFHEHLYWRVSQRTQKCWLETRWYLSSFGHFNVSSL